MSSSSSPCAACKLQRRKCTQECIFAPYFPADQPQKFANIHKVFGASNVAKLLNELNVSQREDAVNSLAYEADTRLRDPVYGCVGLISLLQQKLKFLQSELSNAKKELAAYIGPQALLPMIPPQPPPYTADPAQLIAAGAGGGQILSPQAAVHHYQAAAVHHGGGGFDVAVGGGGHGYGQGSVVAVSPSFALGGPFDGQYYQVQGLPVGEEAPPQNHHHLQGQQLSLLPQQQQGVAQQDRYERLGSEEKCNGGPSC